MTVKMGPSEEHEALSERCTKTRSQMPLSEGSRASSSSLPGWRDGSMYRTTAARYVAEASWGSALSELSTASLTATCAGGSSVLTLQARKPRPERSRHTTLAAAEPVQPRLGLLMQS